ncbi:MAG: sigma-70 family RNA polymerase sigma factor [Clostridia bacterium]|nr:sigma-70 family RNA polymerase sigma factor [Clostridia bacterium]
MMSDARLTRRMKLGSRRAADELFDRYYREIYAYIYRQCGERELALDLTQETFTAAFRGIRGYDEKKAGFRTWLYRIAGNKVTDHYRSKAYRAGLYERPLESLSVKPAFDGDGDITERLEKREEVQRIMRLVSEHELSLVRIFQKKCFEELTFAEIASELGLSEGTVKTRYYAMIKRIRKELAE